MRLVLDSKTPGHERLRVSADGRPSTVGFALLLLELEFGY